MQKLHDSILFSPSDLTLFMQSPYSSWMDRFALEFPDQAPAKDADDALMQRLSQKGYVHEEQVFEKLKAEGKNTIAIDGRTNAEKTQHTIEAMKSGYDVIFQSRLELQPFAGYADFLIKVEGDSDLGSYHYEVWDAKLSSQVKTTYLIQLCAYAEMLQQIQGCLPKSFRVVLGNDTKVPFRTADFYANYQRTKQRFLAFHDQWNPESPLDPAEYTNWGKWSDHAKSILTERDHLFQLANIRQSQIKKLHAKGIATVQALADFEGVSLRGMDDHVLQRLKMQAKMHICTRTRQESDEHARPCFEIIQPQPGEKLGLALLPPASKLDIFFDIEGNPLEKGGLEYLWGATYFDEQGQRQFKDFWAHNHEQEKQAFKDFIMWAYGRWKKDPSMHIYHYANYEIAACRRLMGRYGICEFEVDELLRNDVFVDLYKIVRGGMVIGEPKYSIKNVEHLYRDARTTDVGSGGDSVVVYEQWKALFDQGQDSDDWQKSELLKGIRDYNIDDCNSTQELVEWLRKQQRLNNISFEGSTSIKEAPESEEQTKITALRDRLLLKAETGYAQNAEEAKLAENLAWMLEFHHREAKPVFWKLFDRLGQIDTDLLDDIECLACCERTEKPAFKRTPRARNLTYEYRFDPNQEFKHGTSSYYVLGLDDEGKRVKVTVIQEFTNLDQGLIALQCKMQLPQTLSLIPNEYVDPKSIPVALEYMVRKYDQGHLEEDYPAILDFLKRQSPRFKSGFKRQEGQAIVHAATGSERLEQTIQAVQQLNQSYLTIQGPPGTGKTYTAKYIIARLIESGAKVGVCSNSHKAINHLVRQTKLLCNHLGIKGTFVCTKDSDESMQELGITKTSNRNLPDFVRPACVLGTTAWGFTLDDMMDQLDYLFVDEAGQVAVANLVAISRSAKNLVILGDQMQLGQPTQGTHPAESGLSVLDYLLHEQATIQDDLGIFLNTTYRMHPTINSCISEAIYESKLVSATENDQRVLDTIEHPKDTLESIKSGLVYVPLKHTGNVQSSDEEVNKIVELKNQLLKRRMYDTTINKYRDLSMEDFLFVAPYNYQVRKLKEALGPDAKVGSVDKFQGQEAPIVFLSMCSSNPEESPRGIPFLFDKNRLNVAISRAQTLALIVANEGISDIATEQVEQLKLLNVYQTFIKASIVLK